ncbi:hyalin-like [Glandiceps talaboti]
MNHVCTTWCSSIGYFEVFVNGSFVASGIDLARGHIIKTGGHITLGHALSDADDSTPFLGEMTGLQIYNRIPADKELASLANDSCNDQPGGNIYSWHSGNLIVAPTDIKTSPLPTCPCSTIIADTISPVVTCPPSQTVEYDDGYTSTVVKFSVESATDNSGITPTVTCNPPSGNIFISGVNTVMCSATDDSRNTGFCNFTLTVQDTISPVVTCPPSQTVEYDDGYTSTVVKFSVESATDNSGITPTVTCNPPSGNIFISGVNTVMCSATDDSRNTGFCNFTLTVQDTISPVVTCPPSQTVEYDDGYTSTVVKFSVESATDNSGITPTVTCNPPSGNIFISGVNTVMCSATDDSRNTGFCNFTLTVQDTISPVVTCPPSQTVEYDDGYTSTVVKFSVESATDNSGITPTVTCNPPSGNIFISGVNTVMCSATDDSGNTGFCNFTLTVQDTISPVVTCPPSQNVEYDDGYTTTVVKFSVESATDNSGITPTVTCNPPSGNIFISGVNTVMCSATDDSGNTGFCNFTLTVQDTISPVVTCPPSQTVEYDDGYTSTVVKFSVESATDNSGITPTVTCNPPSGNIFISGVNTVMCSATDDSGNIGFCNFTLTVQDTISPVVTCPPSQTVEYDDGYTSTVVKFSVESATDNSGITPTVTCNPPSGNIFISGVNTVMCSATDDSGNTGFCNFTLTVQDTISPVVTCPPSQTVEYDDNYTSTVVKFSVESATDNSGITSTVTCNPPSGNIFISGVNTVMCSATDDSGNIGFCNFTLTVQDTISPVVTCPPSQNVEYDDGYTTTVVKFSVESATDNSGITPTVTCNPPSGNIFISGVNTVMCSATDDSGNTGFCNFTLTVQDTISPVVTCPPSQTVEYDDGYTSTVVKFSVESATDNSGITPTVTCNPPSGNIFISGVNTVMCSATDDSGNIGFCNFTLTVQDTISPVVTCPPSQTVEYDDGYTSTVVKFSVESATDNSGITPTVTCNPPSGNIFISGVNTVMCSATDDSGNTGFCNFTLTVQDTISPVVTCPPSQNVEYDDGYTTTVVKFSVESATDNSGITPTVTCNPPSGNIFISGVNTVMCSATDDSGNTGFCNFTLTVQDTISPVVTCPPSQTVEYDDGYTSTVVKFSVESATDNSGITPTVTCNPPSGNIFISGVNTVMCSATDDSGNIGFCNFTLTVQDTISPVVTCPPSQTVEYDDGYTSTVVKFSVESATDNSGITPTVTCNPPSGNIFISGVNTVMCSATDDSGNTGFCNFTLTVQDTISPVVTCPPSQTVEYDDGYTSTVVKFSVESATDNSGITPTVTCNPPSGNIFISGVNTVICSATDDSGNTGFCNFTLTVQDTIAPVVTCPPSQSVEYDSGDTAAVIMFIGGSATDNSGTTPRVECNPPSGSTFNRGVNTVTCSATDDSGNTGYCTFTLTVQANRIDSLIPVGCVLSITESSGVNFVTSALERLEEITVSVWVKTLADGPLFSYSRPGADDELVLSSAGNLQVRIHGVLSEDSNIHVNNGEWNHVCLTWSSSNGQWDLWINAILIKSGVGLATGEAIGAGGTFKLGRKQSNPSIPSEFSIDIYDFHTWSQVLGQNEIGLLNSKCSQQLYGDVFTWHDGNIVIDNSTGVTLSPSDFLPGGCKSDVLCYNNYGFKIIANYAMTWETAKSECENMFEPYGLSSYLAILDEKERSQVADYLLQSAEFRSPRGKGYWIGCSDIGSEGNFVWIDGSVLQDISWRNRAIRIFDLMMTVALIGNSSYVEWILPEYVAVSTETYPKRAP